VSRSFLATVAQSLLVVAGATLGFCHAFRPDEAEPASKPQSPAPRPDADYVTRLELAEALDRVAARSRAETDTRINERLRGQDEAIAALHQLTLQTSEMVERLLTLMQAADDEEAPELPVQPLHAVQYRD
jgi:hypothetical protein